MTELRPLIESSDDELERALLRSVQVDAPSPAALRQAALAVGLSTVTANALAAALPAAATSTAASTLTTAASAPVSAVLASHGAAGASGVGAATSVASASSAAVVGSGTLVVLGKGLVGGALISLATLTAFDHVQSSPAPAVQATLAAPARPAVTSSSRPPAAALHTMAPEEDAVTPEVAPEPSRVPSAPPEAVPRLDRRGRTDEAARVLEPQPSQGPASAAFAPVVASAAAPAARPASSSLAAELRLLDQARAAIAAGHSNRAAQLLDAYAASRPSGVLAQEAALLRVRLLLGLGDRHAAAELARQTIAAHPESAHADWLRDTAALP